MKTGAVKPKLHVVKRPTKPSPSLLQTLAMVDSFLLREARRLGICLSQKSKTPSKQVIGHFHNYKKEGGCWV